MRMTPALVLLTVLACSHAEPGRALAGNNTKVQQPGFSLTLPGSWERQSNERDLEFSRDADRVFITVLAADKTTSGRERRRFARRIAEMRRQLLMDLSHGRATTTEVSQTDHDGYPLFQFTGTDPQNDKRFAVSIIALPAATVTVALTRPLSASPEGFDQLAAAMLRSLRE